MNVEDGMIKGKKIPVNYKKPPVNPSCDQRHF